MLCPEVWNFPAPKVVASHKLNESLQSILKTVDMNNFYKSVIITIPDEMNTSSFIDSALADDTDYYKVLSGPLSTLVNPVFIENFINNGRLYCLSCNTNCIVQNCFAITPDGKLTIHVLEFIFQTLGLEGVKRPHNYYEIVIDLKRIKNYEKIKQSLNKLESFDFNICWEPKTEDICPSSIAKYFNDKGYKVSVCSLQTRNVTPSITEIPSVNDTEIDEIVEWIGMLAHQADITPTEAYISSYSQPDSENPIKSNRISVSITKGFLTPNIVTNVVQKMVDYVSSRELDNYWACVSVQSNENSLWQWCPSAPRMFQAQDSSCNIFLTNSGHKIYSIGQIKYS